MLSVWLFRFFTLLVLKLKRLQISTQRFEEEEKFMICWSFYFPILLSPGDQDCCFYFYDRIPQAPSIWMLASRERLKYLWDRAHLLDHFIRTRILLIPTTMLLQSLLSFKSLLTVCGWCHMAFNNRAWYYKFNKFHSRDEKISTNSKMPMKQINFRFSQFDVIESNCKYK